MLGISGKKLHHWYKSVLSGFETASAQQSLHEHDLQVKNPRGVKEIIQVPILKPQNMGKHMAIDEKNIAGKCFTILTNRETGKISLMANTLIARHLHRLGLKLGDTCFEVESLTRDLANNYDWLGRQLFMNAEHIGDKFHILRHGFDALQSVRIRLRQQELTHQRLTRENHRRLEQEKKKLFKEKGLTYRVQKYKEELLQNGDTKAQLLVRSRYLLFKFKSDWTTEQEQRAKLLFKLYPAIKTAYTLISRFRKWYDKKQVGKSLNLKTTQLNKWYQAVRKQKIEEVENFADLVKRHEGVTLNYFKNGFTNAYAESLNAKIQRMLSKGHGTKNLDFFLFRIKILFA